MCHQVQFHNFFCSKKKEKEKLILDVYKEKTNLHKSINKLILRDKKKKTSKAWD